MQYERVNMDNYRFTSRQGFGILSPSNGTRGVLHSLGAFVGPEDGDLDGCTSCEGNSNDDVTFSF
jgi:hypothetical protein